MLNYCQCPVQHAVSGPLRQGQGTPSGENGSSASRFFGRSGLGRGESKNMPPRSAGCACSLTSGLGFLVFLVSELAVLVKLRWVLRCFSGATCCCRCCPRSVPQCAQRSPLHLWAPLGPERVCEVCTVVVVVGCACSSARVESHARWRTELAAATSLYSSWCVRRLADYLLHTI